MSISSTRLAVLGSARHIAQCAVLRLPPRPQAHALGIGGFDFGRWPKIDRSRGAVDDHGIVGIGDADRIGDLADRRNPESPGDDRNVGVRGALFEHEAAQSLAIIVEQRRRPHAARDQDRVVGQLLARRRVVAAHQLPHQAVAEVLEIMQALAQVRIGRAQHPRAGIGLHPLDRSFRSKAGADGFMQAMGPAVIVGEHAIGFEHVAVLAAIGNVATLQQAVEVGA